MAMEKIHKEQKNLFPKAEMGRQRNNACLEQVKCTRENVKFMQTVQKGTCSNSRRVIY